MRRRRGGEEEGGEERESEKAVSSREEGERKEGCVGRTKQSPFLYFREVGGDVEEVGSLSIDRWREGKGRKQKEVSSSFERIASSLKRRKEGVGTD